MHFYAYVFEREFVGGGRRLGFVEAAVGGGAGAGVGARVGVGEGSAGVVEDFEFVEGGVRGGCCVAVEVF